MTTDHKIPSLLPVTLGRILAASVVLSAAVVPLTALGQLTLARYGLIISRNYKVFPDEVLWVAVIASVGLAALYVACLPVFVFRHFHARRRQQRDDQRTAERWAHDYGQAQKAKYDAYRAKRETEINDRIRAEGQAALKAYLAKTEQEVLAAYASYALEADFFGVMPEIERQRRFAKQLPSLGIRSIGVLRHSHHPSIRRFLTFAPALPVVEVEEFYPKSHELKSLSSPISPPNYNPFEFAVYSQPQQTLKQPFLNKLFALKRS